MRRRPPRSTRTDTLFPYSTLFRSGKPARLALERHACVGDGRKFRLQAAFPFNAGDRTFLLERDEGVPAADFDVVKGGFDDRAIVEDRTDLPDDFLALLQRRTGRQFIFDLAVVAVDRRLELLRQDHEQDDARRKGEEADADDPDAMIEQPRPKAPDHDDRRMAKGPLAHPHRLGKRAEQECKDWKSVVLDRGRT